MRESFLQTRRDRRSRRQESPPAPQAASRFPMKRTFILAGVAVGAFALTYLAATANWRSLFSPAPPAGMRWVPGGEFTMGSDAADVSRVEQPAHRVRVDGFWMDETDVTNAQFRAFVEATGYRTTAEKPVDWEEFKKQFPPGTPKPADLKAEPGSLVFTPPDHPVPLDDVSKWWKWTPGADWRHPEGPGSSIDGKVDHPVVQVSWDDAVAYAKWAGKRLPTEAEWERAARGGLEGKKYVWGDEPFSEDHPQCNNFQGHFPDSNTKKDGYVRTSPVKAFPPNGYGLYDMSGNVWQWCGDWFLPEAYALTRRPVLARQSDRPGARLRPAAACARARPARRLVSLLPRLLLQLPTERPDGLHTRHWHVTRRVPVREIGRHGPMNRAEIHRASAFS